MIQEKVYSINYTKCVQVSPDDWESYQITMEINDQTTILDIKLFVAEQENIDINKVNLMGIKIGRLIKL